MKLAWENRLLVIATLSALALGGCLVGKNLPNSLTVANAGPDPVIVQLSGPTVPETGYRIGAGTAALLLKTEVPDGSEPTVTLVAFTAGCAEFGRMVLRVVGEVLVTVDGTKLSSESRVDGAPIVHPAPSGSQLAGTDACPLRTMIDPSIEPDG
jgi:hypothetical protein